MEPDNDNHPTPPESNLPAGNPFTVPEGYFDALSGKIMSRIAVGDFEEKSSPFTAPEGYFELLSEQVMAKKNRSSFDEHEDAFFLQQAETIQSEITIRERAGTLLPFETPEGYFEKLSAQIGSKTYAKSASGSVLYFRIRRWVPAAAAAVLVIMIQLFTTPGTPSVAASSTITGDSLTTEEIALHLEKADVDEDILVKSVDVSSLSVYRNEAAPANEAEEQKILDQIDASDISIDM